MTAYYNEFDPAAAAWLRELIKAGHVAPGVVDERSIEDVLPSDLAGFTQCHFFAGIGVWSYALRRAGWTDDRPVWTGSCPCQPFSTAGKGSGFDDERHLWPAFHHLIEQCRPAVVLGEQVASKDGLAWLDLVQADMEGADYAFGAVDTCAAGFGAPHIRQRLYWVANAGSERVRAEGLGETGAAPSAVQGEDRERQRVRADTGAISAAAGWLADTTGPRQQRGRSSETCDGRNPAWVESERFCHAGSLEHTSGIGRNGREAPTPGHHDDGQASDRAEGEHGFGESGPHRVHQHTPGPTNGFWRNADWLLCRDAKWRPVEPGTFPLASGASARVGRLRGYGNGLCAPQAQGFIEAVMGAV